MNTPLVSLLFRSMQIGRMPFYAVARGRKPGIYLTWPECENQVKGFKNPIFKKFATRSEAEKLISMNGGGGETTSEASTTTTGKRSASDSSASSTFPVAKKAKSYELSDVVAMRKHGDHYFMEDTDGFVQVYTDGSCEGNGTQTAIAGLGVYFSDGHALNTAKAVSGRATNNCGEIQAASMAIRLASESGIRKLCINTDSQFVINAVTKWLPGWIRKGWKLASGGPVKNVLDFQELNGLLKDNSNMTIKWNYVKAHCGIIGNERADELARQGGQMFKAKKLARK